MELLVVTKNMNFKGTMQRLMDVVQVDLAVMCAKRVCNVQMDTTTVVLRLATGTCVHLAMNPLLRNEKGFMNF